MSNRKLEFVPLSEWGVFSGFRPSVIAGPCSAESEEQLMQTARRLCESGIGVLRAGLWKPRTHPGSFEGVGAKGLKWMQRAKNEFGLRIATEVAGGRHVAECLEHGVDMVWLGARTTTNPFLVQEIADALKGSDIPVLVKNPVNPDMDLWIGALERLDAAGVRKLGVVHRGFSTVEKTRYRNAPEWQIAIELRSLYPNLPFFCDPSHISGSKEYIREIAQRSLDLGLDGLMIEVHCDPSGALSDAAQQLTPSEFDELLHRRLVVRDADSDSPQWKDNIDLLRTKIDVIDESILNALASRMEISRRIGQYKKDNNVAILQTSRWDAVLAKVLAKGREYGLPEEFVSAVFNSIHEASVEVQNEIISEQTSERK